MTDNILELNVVPAQAFIEVVGFVVSIALLAIASLIRVRSNRPRQDDAVPTTLSDPNSQTPYLEGTRIQGYGFGWAGDRVTRSRRVGGKGFMGGGGGQEITYEEGGVHWWGPGPYTALFEIRINNKAEWTGFISPTSTPSGTRVNFGDLGSAIVFWGEDDQPIDTYQARHRGIRSRWPGAAHLCWDRFKKGQNRQWPQIEYKLERRLASSLIDSEGWLSASGSTGVNAAHAICRIITDIANIPASTLDNTTLEALGELMVTEHLPVNYLSPGGSNPDTVETFMQAVSIDMGVMYPQIGSVIGFVPIRAVVGSVPSYTDDTVEDPAPELIKAMQYNRVDMTRFSFVDEAFNYRSRPLYSPDNSMRQVGRRGRIDDSKITLVTKDSVAEKIARRRELEPGGTGDEKAVTVNLLRGAKLQHPGTVIDVDGVGRLRVFRRRIQDNSSKVELQCRIDGYSVTQSERGFGSFDPFGEPKEPAKDIAFTWVTLPSALSDGTFIIVFRVQANNQIDGAVIHVSVDSGNSYTAVGTQFVACAGGITTDSITGAAGDLIDGPAFNPQDDKTNDVLDLTANTNAWTAGQQLVLFDDGTNKEIMYLRNVAVVVESDWIATTAYSLNDYVVPTGDGAVTGLRYICTTAGTTGADEPDWPREVGDTVTDGTAVWEARYLAYELKGLKRAKFTTAATAFAASTQIYIIEQDALTLFSSSLIVNGNNLCVKTQPFGSGGSPVLLSAVTADCEDVDRSTVK